MPDWRTPMEEIEVGTGRTIPDGKDVAILTLGHIGNYAVEACELLEEDGIDTAHYDMRFAKPLDERLLHSIGKKFKYIITIEDGCLQGGFGSAILEFMADNGYFPKLMRLGIPDEIIEHGTQLQLHEECGFDPKGIYKSAKQLLHKELALPTD